MSGALLPHLTATDTLLSMIKDSLQSKDEQLVGFILESYFYFKTVAYNVGFDVFNLEWNIDALERLNNASSYVLLKRSSVFGFLFGQSFDLFRLIPQVAQLAHLQPSRPTEPRHTAPEILTEFYRIENLILAWGTGTSPPMTERSASSLSDSTTGGLLQQYALLIFLRAALYGPGRPVDYIAKQIDQIASEFIVLLRTLTEPSLAWTNLLWATSITGSCLQNFQDREYLAITLQSHQHQMNTSLRVLEILRWVWAYSDSDPECYGPHGITKVSIIKDVKLSIG